ncbi:hypothetical protein AB0M29_38750 [Streptomyces sp. NPDC051976]|uniref:hypothetical protein n=1 Tax=Streptomyces sp. NPDC051976 TaxID=3154947 RepID=UPI00341A6028
MAIGSLAWYHLLATNHRAALDLYREEQQLAILLADILLQANALMGTGETHAAAGQIEKARHAWQEAQLLYEEIKHPWAAQAHHRLDISRKDPTATWTPTDWEDPETMPPQPPETSPTRPPPAGEAEIPPNAGDDTAPALLLTAGHSRRSIQRQLGMTYRTVQRLADAATPEDLFQGQWQNRRPKLDDFKPYLSERWAKGCTNAWTLWGEIKTHGYRGGYGAVRAYLQPFRTTPTAPAARPPSPRTVAGWILTNPDTLRETRLQPER